MAQTGVVLGGSGFIGTHLLRRLAAENKHSQLISIDIAEQQENLSGVEYRQADLRERIDSTGIVNPVIYNLVALRNFPGHPFQDYYDTNVTTTQRAIDLAETTGGDTIVFTSTMSIYGPGEEPKIEQSVLNPVNPYGSSKKIGEVLNAGWLARNPGAKMITCRPAVIFGHRDNGNYTRLARLLERGLFVYVGRKDTIKSAGYVGDLIDSFLFCLDHQDKEILYNFAYPHAYTIEEIVAVFREVAGYGPARGTLPLGMLSASALPFEFANALGIKNPIHRDRIRKLNESTNIVPKWLIDNGFRFRTDLKSALQEWKSQSRGGRFE